ncbi:hypothetical protein [Subtercola boreus]|uniref:Uncharacterized protein n=1 Tax=Subtercola boreus TaxID=120213 RepID=A0A3E0WFA5_9MICO|nr:hypothetical protein [Subtercola boreus]RFA22526.1 hypothetical protein B7R24_02565 [Subtercola boreus]RFA22882.1 hypothetical protein B7R23_02560 [Subtercola boreus]RFA28634.1 hypothetical protein B7R25_02575 [Subtercola boreus]
MTQKTPLLTALYAFGVAAFIIGAILLFAAYAPDNDTLESAGIITLLVAWAVLVNAAIMDALRHRS